MATDRGGVEMDEGNVLSEDELNEVSGHLQAMMDAIATIRTGRSDPEELRNYWSRYFKHQAEVIRLVPPRE